MKKTLILIVILVLTSSSRAGVTVTPQAGVNGTYLTSDLADIAYSAQVGYQFGLNVRLGGFFHIQPGVYWQRSQKELLFTLADIQDDVLFDQINVPLLFGIKPIPLKLLELRINTGPSVSFVTSVGDNLVGLEKEDFKSPVWGLVFGVGVDILFISVDVNYELGLTNLIDTDSDDLDEILSSKANVLRVNLGLRLGN